MFHLRRLLLLGLLFLCMHFSAFSQNPLNRTLNWEVKTVALPDNINTKQIETFGEAIFDYRFKDLSIYTEKLKQAYASVEIVNAVYKPLTIQLNEEQKQLIKILQL